MTNTENVVRRSPRNKGPAKLNSSDSSASNASPKSTSKKVKTRTNSGKIKAHFDKEEMEKYVIWRRPIQTLFYFLLELVDIIVSNIAKLLTYRKLVVLVVLVGDTRLLCRRNAHSIVAILAHQSTMVPVLGWPRCSVVYWLGNRSTHVLALFGSFHCSSDTSCV